MAQPASGFDDPAVFAIFHPPAVTPSAVSIPTDTAHKVSNTAAIAGGVVGGVVGAAIIAVITFCWMRKRKSASKSHKDISPLPELDKEMKGDAQDIQNKKTPAEVAADHEIRELPVDGMHFELSAGRAEKDECYELLAEETTMQEKKRTLAELQAQGFMIRSQTDLSKR